MDECERNITHRSSRISVQSSATRSPSRARSQAAVPEHGDMGGCGNQAMWEQYSFRLSGCSGLSRCLRGAESGHAALTALEWDQLPGREVGVCCPPQRMALNLDGTCQDPCAMCR